MEILIYISGKKSVENFSYKPCGNDPRYQPDRKENDPPKQKKFR